MVKMGTTTNIDDLLVKVQNESTEDNIRQPEVAAIEQPEPTAEGEPKADEQADENIPQGNPIDKVSTPEEVPEEEKSDDLRSSSPSDGSPIDEYGNPVEKPKTYTEEEVQRMIRDRLSRGRHAEQQPAQQQPQQKAAEGFTADPNSEESWEAQLEQFIEKTIDKRQTKQSEAQWRQQESARQAEFESKFSSGMNKYQDFHQVVSGKPITDSMMMATRNLENPAAFVYAASKMHAAELQRIASI